MTLDLEPQEETVDICCRIGIAMTPFNIDTLYLVPRVGRVWKIR